MCGLIFLVFLVVHSQIEAFNLSPYPNRVIKYPGHPKQTRSSYFGYSLVIRPKSIIVGAPRAQSTLETQSAINEPGEIYRCSLENGDCTVYVLDSNGNYDSHEEENLSSHHKDFQWLGGSMDGGTQDTDKLLVCAPRLYTHSSGFVDDVYQPIQYHLHGICYSVNNTLTARPQHVTPISPLRAADMQEIKNGTDTRKYFIMGELGLSAHVPDDNSKFLIGAPGIDDWKGSVFLYQQPGYVETTSNVAKRDTSRALSQLRPKRDISSSKKILEPNWDQEIDSYFGYAVSSGYFNSANLSTLLYLATAPQANKQSGEAYIFAVDEGRIHWQRTFRGDQFGEYFGYSVLAEDLNSDGKTDFIISAPFHSLDDSYDNGAIYVFINKGSFHFERTIVTSPVGSKGRFGTTLSRLGDINHDGFNDIAVGAPFAGNGSVFIYLGGKLGLRDQPSQRLDAPAQQASKYGTHMFGHGLSRGADIDGNGFNDFAIGAPNSEAVYLYRSYPVVKIHATVKFESREMKPGQDTVMISACFKLSTTANMAGVEHQELDFRVVIDKELNRARFAQTQSNEMSFKANASLDERCHDIVVQMGYSPIFDPIDLEMSYELARKVHNSKDFCETCAIVDPFDSKVSSDRITFNTGCAKDECVVDLKLKSRNVSHTFVFGSANTISLSYEITNNGENAFYPKFNVTSSSSLPFAKVPGNCFTAEAVLVCKLNHGRPLAKGVSDFITISFDVGQLSGESLTISAEVHSAGSEENPTDNIQIDEISLREFTEIDASGGPANGQVALKCIYSSAEIMNHYEVKSRGPSSIKQLTLSLYIPVAYKAPGSEVYVPIINMTSLHMQATYDSHMLPIKLYDQNDTLLNTFPITNSTHGGLDYDQTRSRRDLQSLLVNQTEEAGIFFERLFEKPPLNRSIVLDCRETNTTICAHAEMHVTLRPYKPININISFNVDLRDIKEPWEYFVIQTDVELVRAGDPTSSSFVINGQIEPSVLYTHAGLSIWKIIMAVIGGGLILSAITYGFHKLGFFKRTLRNEKRRLIRESFEENIIKS
ncbi:integrin alpha-PS3-like [Drosophila elegans]|uniref:integrin alpha-PS3-like n=1 Tax=Drosophila elegans TaxID=30023 RepID=UPI0007E754C6|nr:integrin alpha-PS3-like [Drosophila elegans]